LEKILFIKVWEFDAFVCSVSIKCFYMLRLSVPSLELFWGQEILSYL
jgi:hypothetical protein